MDISHSTRRLANPGGRVRDAGSPGAQLLAWCHAGTGFVLEALAAPWHTHDMAEVATLHAARRPGDGLVGERAFCSLA